MTTTQTEPSGVLLDTAEVCAKLKIGRTKLYHLRKEGFPEPARFGHRSLRWREADVDAWFEQQRGAA